MPKLLWTNRSNFGAAPRSSAAMCFDSARGRTILFGGQFPAPTLELKNLGDTWEWDGAFWTQMEDTGPSARRDLAMVFDSDRKVAVLFGGTDDNGPFGDTWQWDGTSWTKLLDSGPGARSRMAMAFDSARNRVVLFGGSSSELFHTGETWEFDGESWTQMEDVGPPVRCGHAMAFDPVGKRVLLFGGAGANKTGLSDTWAWDGANWAQVAEFGPSPRLNAAMSATAGGQVLVFGGIDSDVSPITMLADTWEFDGKRWTQRQDIGPGPLDGAAMSFDSARSSVVLFGGRPPHKPGDPDVVSGLTWESLVAPVLQVPPVVTPPAGPLRLVSISVPPKPKLFNPISVTFTLSGPAIAGGTLVHVAPGSLVDLDGVDLISFRIPEGVTTFPLTTKLAATGAVTIAAGIEGLQEATVTVNVSTL